MKVIDISYHQGNKNDFNAVRADGVEGVIIRAGYGRSTIDKYFVKNIEGALAAGLQVGVYWFIYAKNNAESLQNAKKFIQTIAPYKDKITLAVWSDWEYDSDEKAQGQTVASRTEIVRVFNQALEDAGYRVGTYTNIDYYRNKFNMSVLSKWELWLADYSGECDYPCTMRQYTSKGSVNGIKGNVDLDTWFGKPTQTIYTEVNTVNIKLTVLKKGSKGEQVKTVQRLLNSLGYKGKNGKPLSVDGDFGTNTDYAVRNYQGAENITSDGVVGAKTWEHLIK